MATGEQSQGAGSDGGEEDTHTLSTGHTVEFPLAVEATMVGAVFSAPAPRVAELLPERLDPIRVRGGAAPVSLLSVEYHDMDIEGLDPYDEFVVLLPADHELRTDLPYLSALNHASDGYVWYMPVTTRPAYALGVDVWGYPKVVGDITHEDHGSVRETTVTVDGEHVATLAVDRPPSMHVEDDGFWYTHRDGDLLHIHPEFDAELGVWPLSSAVSLELGDHPKAERLRELGLGGRALARVSAEGTVHLHPGEPV